MPDEPSIFTGNLPAHVQEALRACEGRAFFTHRSTLLGMVALVFGPPSHLTAPIPDVVAPNHTLRVRVEGGPVLWESPNV